MSLREWIENISHLIEHIFNMQEGLVGMYHMVDKDGRELMVMAPMGESKDAAIAAMRQFMRENNIVRYAYMDEAWTVRVAEAEGKSLKQWLMEGHSASDHPQRVEIVVITAEDAKEGELTAHRDILRSAGRKPRLGPLVMIPSVHSVGRMVGMLPRPKNQELH